MNSAKNSPKEFQTIIFVSTSSRVPCAGTGEQESADTGQPRVGDQPDASTAVERRNSKLYHERFGH